jgi:DNA-binding IclR family transcriptional regulator
VEPVQSIARALDALEVLAAQDDVGLMELARRLDLAPSSAHRLLATLTLRGWVVQSPDSGRYGLSYRVLGLAARLHPRTARLRAAVRPYLERAHKVSGATANLVVLQGRDVVYLDQVGAGPQVGTFVEAGRSVPAHSAGAGKALMAQRPEDELPILRSPEPYERFTRRTITTAHELRRELARVRRRGFAVDDEEHEAGVTCVAAPVFDRTGEAVAAISVSGPADRMRVVGLRELGDFLVILTGELSSELAISSPPTPDRA